jgi:hypothetical protein
VGGRSRMSWHYKRKVTLKIRCDMLIQNLDLIILHYVIQSFVLVGIFVLQVPVIFVSFNVRISCFIIG